ncbi:hypothetical protein D9619_006340 [Psilocybe cf. subviscida]|uniref:Uncharacterized protein n=1 Tax=Psilocybe cf. subviscida TaxID=2480587 RepID=A0A8H5B4N9_9AGAR|nr:hypothetical protein D9619_006340 [Psilocybe cf. subviscida]
MSNFAFSIFQRGSAPGSSSRMMIFAETVIQVLALGVIGYAWFLCTFHVGIGWLILRHQSYLYGGAYVALVNTLVPCVARLYIHLALARSAHSIAQYPSPDKDTLTEPYVCVTADGDLDIGNCVTFYNLKAFLYLLYIVPLAFTVAIWPFADTLMDHISSALYASYYSAWANEVWWDRTASWILCAGPLGRWVIGTILGYVVLAQQRARAPNDVRVPGDLIEEPHLRIALIAGRANSPANAVMCCAGSGPYYNETDSPRCDNIRDETDNNIIIVTSVLPNERIYDLGPSVNWRAFWQRPVFDTSVPSFNNF